MTAGNRGMSLPEVLIASVIFAVVLLGTVVFVKKSSEGLFHLLGRISTEERLRMVNQDVLRDLGEMNEVLEVDVSSITFVLDSHRFPGYNPNALVRGLAARYQPDQDGDAVFLATAPGRLRYMGNDLDDDDDDNDGRIDVQCRYKFSNGQIQRWFNYNEAGWIESPLVRGGPGFVVNEFSLTPAGAKSIEAYAAWDTNADGEVSQSEIAVQGGDPLFIDTRPELAAVATFRVDMEIQKGKEKIKTSTQIIPPLLVAKRKAP